MKRYSEKFILKIKSERQREKTSFRKLGIKYRIPDATIGDWCRSLLSLSDNKILINNEKKRLLVKQSEQKIVLNYLTLDNKMAKLLTAILYGCEGSKYPSSKGISFANCDPKLVLTFLKLLKKSFRLKSNKFSVHLQIHSNQRFQDLKIYWSKLLKIPAINFIKPTITTATGKKHRENYMGTCTLRYRDYKVQLKLLGIYEKFIEIHGK